MKHALVPFVTLTCDSCQNDIFPAPFLVLGNPENFCSLTCCKIFYGYSNQWIRQYREERT